MEPSLWPGGRGGRQRLGSTGQLANKSSQWDYNVSTSCPPLTPCASWWPVTLYYPPPPAGWAAGGRAMSVCIAQDGGWLCVPTSPPEPSASASISNSFQVFCRLRWGGGKGEGHGMGLPLRRGLAGASKGAAHAQWSDSWSDSDTDRTPGVTTDTANGSPEEWPGEMGLPDGKGDES